MARVKKIGHDDWQARAELRDKADAAGLRLPTAITDMRLALGFSQAEFAKAFGLTLRRVSDLENGRGNPGLATLAKIGRPFGFVVGFLPKSTRAEALKQLSADFDRRLESLQDPHARRRMEAVMAAQGKAKKRPKAGG